MSRDDYLHQQAWNYFALHAQQRLTTVNFYLVVATALTAAAVASFRENFGFPGVRLPAGLLLSLLSFAFWRLDLRNRELIKAAEAALRALEASGPRIDDGNGEPPVEWLFTREHRQSAERKGAAGWTSHVVPRTYSHVFNVLFCSFLVTGFLITASAAVTWIDRADAGTEPAPLGEPISMGSVHHPAVVVVWRGRPGWMF